MCVQSYCGIDESNLSEVVIVHLGQTMFDGVALYNEEEMVCACNRPDVGDG